MCVGVLCLYLVLLYRHRAQYWRTKRGFAFFLFTGTDLLCSGHIFFVLKLGVYVRLVKSLSFLSFYLSKQLNESSRTQNLAEIRL